MEYGPGGTVFARKLCLVNWSCTASRGTVFPRELQLGIHGPPDQKSPQTVYRRTNRIIIIIITIIIIYRRAWFISNMMD